MDQLSSLLDSYFRQLHNPVIRNGVLIGVVIGLVWALFSAYSNSTSRQQFYSHFTGVLISAASFGFFLSFAFYVVGRLYYPPIWPFFLPTMILVAIAGFLFDWVRARRHQKKLTPPPNYKLDMYTTASKTTDKDGGYKLVYRTQFTDFALAVINEGLGAEVFLSIPTSIETADRPTLVRDLIVAPLVITRPAKSAIEQAERQVQVAFNSLNNKFIAAKARKA